jgi:hypothetical protein
MNKINNSECIIFTPNPKPSRVQHNQKQTEHPEPLRHSPKIEIKLEKTPRRQERVVLQADKNHHNGPSKKPIKNQDIGANVDQYT